MDSVEVRPDGRSFDRAARALQQEAASPQWRADFTADMDAALAPGIGAARSALMSSGGGLAHEGQPLRQSVAAGVHSAPLHGAPGARIVADKTPSLRGFVNAARRFNANSFRHRVYGRNAWVVQRGAPGWFDDSLSRVRAQLHTVALEVLQRRADRISRKA